MFDKSGLTLNDKKSLSLGDGPRLSLAKPVEETGQDFEKEPQAELSELLQGFKGRAAREDQRFTDAVDSEYWVAFCFQTREQKEEFLQKLGLLKTGDKYLDGMQVARIMGIELASRIPDTPKHRPFDREFVDMAHKLD